MTDTPRTLVFDLDGTLINSAPDLAAALNKVVSEAAREPVMLHPDDAAKRNISEGDPVRLFNERGACLGIAVVSSDVRPGVVQMSTGAWWDPDETGMCRHGNPNALTHDKGTSSLGQGPTAHTCLIEIERYDGELPATIAFDPPKIIKQS